MFAVNLKNFICCDTKILIKNWRNICRNGSVADKQFNFLKSRYIGFSAFENKYKQSTFITYKIGNVTKYCSTLPPKAPQNKFFKQPITWKMVFITFVGGGCLFAFLLEAREKKRNLLNSQKITSIGKAKIGGKFELINQFNQTVTSDDFLGQWLLIYFGFTHCPDICPDEIEKMVQIVDMIDAEKKSHKLTPVFISVDPERDSPAIVGKYVKEFSDKIIGLTGSKEQIASVCKAFRVYYSAGPQDVDKDYIVDHTIIIYLIDPNGKFVDYFGQLKTAREIANIIEFNMVKYDKLHAKGLSQYFGSLFLKNA